MNGTNVNTLIEQGKRKIEARKLQGQLEHEKRERECAVILETEMARFVAQAIEPLKAACDAISIGDLAEINEYRWEMTVPLGMPLCTKVRAEFALDPSQHGDPPRSERTWKLKRFLVPRVELLRKTHDECEEPWSVYESFWSRGYLEATEVEALDEALALASDRFIEFALLEQEAKKRNEAVKTERAQREENESKLVEAQLAAFVPFVYYQVTYGVVADEDGELYANMIHFDSLLDHPFANGYWRMIGGAEKRVEHLVSVERKYVRFAEVMPGWCPRMDTPFGAIAVVPEGAERLEADGLRSAFVEVWGQA